MYDVALTFVAFVSFRYYRGRMLRPGERVSSDSVSVIACLAVLFYSVALFFRCDLMFQWLRFLEHDVPRVHGATPGYRPVSRC